MTKSTFFQALLNVVGNHLNGAGRAGQPNIDIPLPKKLLFTIWLLSKPESFLAVGDRFDIPTSSGHGIFKSTVFTLVELMPQYIKWPNAAQQAESSRVKFSVLFCMFSLIGIENVVGAIDGCDIPINSNRLEMQIILSTILNFIT